MTDSNFTHRWPWHTAIYHRIGEADPIYECGGTVISSNSVLTAAHCVSKSGVRMRTDQILVSVGRLTLNASEDIARNFEVKYLTFNLW